MNIPTVPSIVATDTFYAFDADPFSMGIPYSNSSCIRPQGSKLNLGIRIKVSTNVNINWINYLMNGPAAVLSGGGTGTTGVDLGGGYYKAEYQVSVPAVTGAPRGIYVWNSVNVKNLGDLQSSDINGLSFGLKDSCLTNYSSISSSSNSVCGITNTSKIRCWGANTNNQIDHGNISNPRSYPVVVAGNLSFTQVSSGNTHTCAVGMDGKAYCWGGNTFSQIGEGTTTPALSPLQIDGAVNYSQMSAGANHTCGITSAGVLKCWGYNANRQIGDATTTQRTSPVTTNAGTTYNKIAVGATHSCGITSANILHCWGLNSSGQVGDGTFTQRTTPVVVDSGVLYSYITGGTSHSCGVTTIGQVKCWGQNTYSQLGDGTTTQSLNPVLIDQ